MNENQELIKKNVEISLLLGIAIGGLNSILFDSTTNLSMTQKEPFWELLEILKKGASKIYYPESRDKDDK